MTMQWSTVYKHKVIPPSYLSEQVLNLRSQGRQIVTLNGSFDLMHAGHLHIIYEASKLGDCLIVALNSDSSIKQYKGSTRPIIPLEYRLQMMTALTFVDYVTWFDETNPCTLLSIIKPDIHVNGDEYGENCIEAEEVKKWGRLHLVPRIPGLATSYIIQRIKEEI